MAREEAAVGCAVKSGFDGVGTTWGSNRHPNENTGEDTGFGNGE